MQCKQIMLTGADISHWQGKVDFKKLAEQIDFVILKLGGTDGNCDFYYVDRMFENNYKLAKEAGLKVGAYWFAGDYSKGIDAGKREGKYIYNLIKNKSFQMPIYIDFEKGQKKYKKENTDYCIAVCKYLETLKYFTGVYSSDISGFKETLDLERLRHFSLWVARYGKKPNYVKEYDIHQFTSKGRLKGISGNVDLNNCYRNLSGIITSKHLNNCK